MGKVEDIFIAQKFVFRLGKILGTTLFSIEGYGESRIVKIEIVQKLIFTLHCLIILFVTINIERLNIFVSGLVNWASFFMLLAYLLLLIVSMVFSAVSYKRLLRIIFRLDSLRTLDINYSYVQKFSLAIMILFYVFNLAYTIFDNISRFSYIEFRLGEDIFYILGAIYPTAIECQLILIFLILKLKISELNSYILRKERLELIIGFHYDIFTTAKDVNNLLYYLLPRFLTTFYALSYSMYMIVMYSTDVIFLIDINIWNASNILVVTIVIYYANAIKQEVRICLNIMVIYV